MNIEEKIKGAIYGMALGDALGLGTEFMTRKEVLTYYPEGLSSFNQFIRDMHRSLHDPGKWTNDTEVILRMLECVMAEGKVDIVKIAHRLLDWFNEGPTDMVAPYRVVIPSQGWADNPIVVSHRAWRNSKLLEASNEALNRALIIGIFADDELPVPEMARQLVNITHDDTRCVASTAVAAMYVRHLLYHDQEPDFNQVYEMCRNIDDRVLYFLRLAHDGNFEDFHIDDEETWWYTRKSLGVALWALWHCKTPLEILNRLVNAGGDADTNASLGMMLAGLKYGYSALPEIKEQIIGRERLDEISRNLTEIVRLHSQKIVNAGENSLTKNID